MPDLLIGSYAVVDGPRGGTYALRRVTAEQYTCDCAPFRRLFSVPPEARTCRHLIHYRGVVEEASRLSSVVLSGPARRTLLESLPRPLSSALMVQINRLLGPSNSWNAPTTTTNLILMGAPTPVTWEPATVASTTAYIGYVDASGIIEAKRPPPEERPPLSCWDRLLED